MTAAEPQSGTLFDAVAEQGAYGGRRVVVTMHEPGEPPVPGPRGPGRRTTSGPADAGAPAWWLGEAEELVLAMVAGGRTCCSDDLHAQYGVEASATGHAFGRLFAGMASRGLIREVGWERSSRPEAHGRRVVRWAAVGGT